MSMRTEYIQYRDLPGASPLFVAFVENSAKAEEFFGIIPRTPELLAARARKVLSRGKSPAAGLLESLREFNRQIAAPESVMKQIDRLGSPGTVAVLTGQQIGFLGGPALSVYKAMSAVLLAQKLEDQGIPAVPVFWLASDDSDFAEVAAVNYLDSGRKTVEVNYPRTGVRTDQMVGTVGLGQVEEGLLQAAAAVRGTGFAAQTERLLRECYQPGFSFAEAFGTWISRLFGDSGLVPFNPLARAHLTEVATVLSDVIERREQFLGAALERKNVLHSSGFHPQVHVDESETFLFWVEGVSRRKLEYQDETFRVKGNRSVRFTAGDLVKELARNPGRLRPSALLRPLVQDFLFPCAAYVGGPAETSYYAQVRALGTLLGLDPVILPRISLTLLDRRSQRYLKKLDLRIGEILGSSEFDLLEKVLRTGEEAEVLDRLDSLGTEVRTRAEDLRLLLGRLDPTVGALLDRSESRMLYHVEKVRNRMIGNSRTRENHRSRQVVHLRDALLPGGMLQERSLSFNQFLAEEGPGLVSRLLNVVDPLAPEHCVCYL